MKNDDERILVLVVDLDNDIGKEGIKTPIIGYDNLLKAAIDFGVKKPHDSDLNAIFYSLQIFKRLHTKGYDVDVALVAGDDKDYLSAITKVSRELEIVKHVTNFTSIYLVSDGVVDEKVVPLLYNYGRVIGVDRIIVEQSRGIEETYILLGRYIRKALTEQPYTRFFLGIPGLILIAYVVSSLIGLSAYIWQITALLLGVALFIKGFGFIDRIVEYWRLSPIVGLTYGLAILLLSYVVIVDIALIRIYGLTINTLKLTINLSFLPFILGSLLLISGRIFNKVVKGIPHTIWRESIMLIPIVFFIVFVNNLNQELSRMGEGDIESLLKLFTTQNISTPLILTIVFTIASSLFFIFLDTFLVKKEESSTESSLS